MPTNPLGACLDSCSLRIMEPRNIAYGGIGPKRGVGAIPPDRASRYDLANEVALSVVQLLRPRFLPGSCMALLAHPAFFVKRRNIKKKIVCLYEANLVIYIFLFLFVVLSCSKLWPIDPGR
jgi:hypothetical protein